MKNVIFLDFKNKRRIKKLKNEQTFQDFVSEIEKIQFAVMRSKSTEETLELEKKLNKLTAEGQKKYNLVSEIAIGEI